MTQLVLASGSQTRAQMLKNAGVDFTVTKPTVDEEDIKSSLIVSGISPRAVADALAESKAKTISYTCPEAMVLGADQLLVKDGNIYSKASTYEEAFETLKQLSDGEHQLISAAVVCQNGEAMWRHIDTVKLQVRPLSDAFIESYLDSLGDDAFWSVGCYQLEGIGAQLFTRVDGDYFTVLGLPLLPFLDFLRRHKMMPL